MMESHLRGKQHQKKKNLANQGFETKQQQTAEKEPTQFSLPAGSLVCDICQITCTGEETMHTHLMGKKHKSKVAQSQGFAGQGNLAQAVASINQFWCDVCKISTTDQSTLNSHLIGKKHMKKVALLGAC